MNRRVMRLPGGTLRIAFGYLPTRPPGLVPPGRWSLVLYVGRRGFSWSWVGRS